MAVANWPAIATVLVEHGRDPGQPAAAIQDGTLTSAAVVSGTVADLPIERVRTPAVIVVGDVVGVGLAAAAQLRSQAGSIGSPP
jgi:siroheme synthase